MDAAALRTAEEGNWHWLAPGFAIDQAPPASSASLPSLLRELDAQLPAGTALTVHVPDPLPGLDGARLQLSRDVQWHAADAGHTAADCSGIAAAARARRASATAQHWLNALRRAGRQPLLGGCRPNAARSACGAAAMHCRRTGRRGCATAVVSSPPASPLPTPASCCATRRAHRCCGNNASATAICWRCRATGIPRATPLRDPKLPRALLLALQPPTAPRLGDARDQPQRAALPAATPPLREPTPWLLLAIVLLFALERWMASARRRMAA